MFDKLNFIHKDIIKASALGLIHEGHVHSEGGRVELNCRQKWTKGEVNDVWMSIFIADC